MTICFDCGGEYRWVYKKGKFHALNVSDDSNHWSDCQGRRKRKSHRLRKPVNHVQGPRIVGANYSPSCGKCSVPPWEVCDCSRFMSYSTGGAERSNMEADRNFKLAIEKDAA